VICVKEDMADTRSLDSTRSSSSVTPARLHPHIISNTFGLMNVKLTGKCGTIRSASRRVLRMNHRLGTVKSKTTAQYEL